MVGIGGVGTKGDNRRERGAFTACGGVFIQNEISHRLFGYTNLKLLGGFFHHDVVDLRGFPHQSLFGIVLPGTGIIHTGGGQCALGTSGHKGQKEPGGPLLVDAHGGVGVHMVRQNGDAVVGVLVPDGFPGTFRHREQPVDKQRGHLALPQIQNQHPFHRRHIVAGEIPDAVGVRD